jgi:biopolymer transport protein ExbB/TolQ
MRDLFLSGGILMYPLLVIALGVVLLAARAGWLLRRAERPAAELDQRLQAIVFWGGMSVVLGLLGTSLGLAQMAHAVRLAGAVEPPLLWTGFAMALVTLVFGLSIFALALLLWFPLRQLSQSQTARQRSNLTAT